MTIPYHTIRHIASAEPNLGLASAYEVQEMARELLEARKGVKQRLMTDTAAQAAEAWQPIETAPKDGSEIILCTDEGHVRADYWSYRHNCWWHHYYVKPVFWQPLPLPPVALRAAQTTGGDGR